MINVNMGVLANSPDIRRNRWLVYQALAGRTGSQRAADAPFLPLGGRGSCRQLMVIRGSCTWLRRG